jgi:outer membrane immunogenic protein
MTRYLKKSAHAFATIVFGLLPLPALAADMAIKTAAPAPTTGWTGFYLGGNLGYSQSNTTVDTNTVAPPVAVATSQSVTLKGAIGGVQAGYNWQGASNWLLGLEADWQDSSEKSGGSTIVPFAVPFFVTGTYAANYDARILWFGTVRGRVGYAWDRVLFYATGGLAYGETKLDGAVTTNAVSLGGPVGGTTAFSQSNVNGGWTIGAGVEGAVARDWTWKAEYLHLDLGSQNVSFVGPLGNETGNVHARFADNVIRVGINYRLN